MRAHQLRVLLLALAGIALGSLGAPRVAIAQRVTAPEARTAAENYVKYILQTEGEWGRSRAAQVKSVQEFRRGDRVLGYYCAVDPEGYLILSLYKDLAPIRAYAGTGHIDPAGDLGTVDILKTRLALVDDAIARRLGRAVEPGDDLRPVLDLSYRDAWALMTNPDFDASGYPGRRDTRGAGMDCQEGDSLLTTTWNQDPPFNDDCPSHGCDWGSCSTYYGYENQNAYVGCVATALAQVIKHWEWPPKRFDWPNMLNTYACRGDGFFQDETGHIATQVEIDAVADISYHCARDVDMDYGCSGSSATLEACEPALEGDYSFDDGCQVKYRDDYTTRNWFDKLIAECSRNRPVGYGIPGHMIVIDGWREEGPYAADYLVHVVYGWEGSNDGWWSVDAIPGGGPDEESIVCQIRPVGSLGEAIDGTYYYIQGSGNYFYFNRDTAGDNVTFQAGLNLQILRSGFLLANSGTLSTDAITFESLAGRPTSLFLHGNPGADVHVRVSDGGAIKVLAGGQLAIY